MKEIADSARISGNLLTDSELQEQASLKMFDYITSVGEFSFSDEQIDTYMNAGGTPRLDGTYTVFGEVLEGIEIVDRIASLETGPSDRPLKDVKILSMKLINK
jgi:peptidyl-prolyl cis-trans isomerase B (cyclophilin B)